MSPQSSRPFKLSRAVGTLLHFGGKVQFHPPISPLQDELALQLGQFLFIPPQLGPGGGVFQLVEFAVCPKSESGRTHVTRVGFLPPMFFPVGDQLQFTGKLDATNVTGVHPRVGGIGLEKDSINSRQVV